MRKFLKKVDDNIFLLSGLFVTLVALYRVFTIGADEITFLLVILGNLQYITHFLTSNKK